MGLMQRVREWIAPPPAQQTRTVQYVPPEVFAEIRRLKEEANFLYDVTGESQFNYGSDGTIQAATVSQGGDGSAMFSYKWAYAQCLFRPSYGSAFYINEMQHRIIRARSRAFCSQNPYWHGTQRHMKTHVVGSGHTWKLIPRDPKSPPSKDAIRKGQRELDDFYHGEENSVYADEGPYRSIQCEKLDRGSRDGEHYLRFMEEGDRGDQHLRLSFIEPLLLWTPTAAAPDPSMEILFGILFRKGDYEKPRGYYIRTADHYGSTIDSPTRPFAAAMIQRRTQNVDRSTPRGVPDTYWVQARLEQSMRTLQAMGTLVQVRAKIAMIAKRVNALEGAVQPVLSANSLGTLRGPGGQLTNVMGLNDGSVINSSNQVDYQFPGQGVEVDKIVASVQAELQSAAQSLGLADYMMSGSLGGNSSYAASMVAEGPVVKNFEEMQQCVIDDDRKVASRVLMLGVEAGRVPEEVLESCKVEMTGCSLAGRNAIQDAQANHIKWQDKVISTDTWRMMDGLDPETEDSNNFDAAEREALVDALSQRAAASVAGMLPGAEQLTAAVDSAGGSKPASKPGSKAGKDQNDGTQKARNKQGTTARPFKPDDEGRQKQRASGATKEEELLEEVDA